MMHLGIRSAIQHASSPISGYTRSFSTSHDISSGWIISINYRHKQNLSKGHYNVKGEIIHALLRTMLLLQCICIYSTDTGGCQNMYWHVVQYCSHSKNKKGRKEKCFQSTLAKPFKICFLRAWKYNYVGVITDTLKNTLLAIVQLLYAPSGNFTAILSYMYLAFH